MKQIFFFIAYFSCLASFAQSPVSSNNQFTFDFYKKVLATDKEGNIFASPFSISSAFAMVYAGTTGETQAEMSRVLGFSNTPNFHQQQASFQENLQKNLPKGLALEVANALWIKNGFNFLPAYQRIMENDYKASLTPVNFNNPKEASGIINAWTSKKTHEKIKEIVKPEHITDLTRLVLTNAIYFKSNWATAFDKKNTQPYPFMLGAGKTQNTPFMHKQEYMPYFENDDLQMIEIPYTDKRASLVVLLPKEKSNIETLEKNITLQDFEKWSKSTYQQDVRLFLPTFKIESDFTLNDYLIEMGIKRAFQPRMAEFGGIIQDSPLHISQVLHKSFIEVNEEGTEAAAVTAIIMNTTESAHYEEPSYKTFFANRPFMFLIKDHATGAILFIGKVQKPS
jgi:serpin B